MKVSDIGTSDIASYLRLSTDDYDDTFLETLKDTAINIIANYTGIPEYTEDTEEGTTTLDDYADFYIVVMLLCQDMYDNRSAQSDNKQLNRTMQTILDMHCQNLIAE